MSERQQVQKKERRKRKGRKNEFYFLQVLHVMSFMIEVVGVGIQPHVAPLAQYLPGLWSESADHNMLRCAILTTLVHMVTGLMVSKNQ